jgi:hypothetical protein
VPPTTSALATLQPNVPPAIISIYTTVSILTHVGNPVTLAPDPINGPPGSPATGPAEPIHPPPPASTTVAALPENTAPATTTPEAGGAPPAGTTLTTAPAGGGVGGGAAAAATVVGGVTVSRDAAGGVVVDGSMTLAPGAAATVGGVAVSVGPGGAVVVAGSSIDLPTAAAASTTGGLPASSSNSSGAVPRGGLLDWRAVGCMVLVSWVLLVGSR